MSGTRPLLDLYKVEGMDDVDLEGLERRFDLLLRDAPGTVNSGDEGVSGGHNVRSEETGLRGMVFLHSETISADFHHTRDLVANTNIQMPATEAMKQALNEGRPGVEDIVGTWRQAIAGAQRFRIDEDSIHEHMIEIVRTAIHCENPDFPGFQQIAMTYPTWATPFSAKADNKQVFSAHAERIIGALVRRIAVIRRGNHRHMLMPAATEFKLGDAPSVVDTMRSVAKLGLDTSRTMLRRGGMIGIKD